MRSASAALAVLSLFGLGADNVNFDGAGVGPLPSNWVTDSTHGGKNARWEIRADATAPSRPNVLTQSTGSSGEFDFPVAIFNKTTCRDGDLSVKFRINGGRQARTAGVVWRYQDVNNYYLLHFSVDQRNIVLYRVRDGKTEPIPPIGAVKGNIGIRHDLKLGEWYVAKVIYRGSHIKVLFGNRQLFEAEDKAINTPGRTGVWTRGHTLASFDDFRIDKKG